MQSTRIIRLVLCGTGLLGMWVIAAQAGPPVIAFTEEVDFDRPEAWAMKRAASLLLFTGMRPPTEREAGSWEFSVEGIWNPSLSKEESRVGFEGTKVEDLNRLTIIPRPRMSVGLGWDTTLEVSYIPPVEIEGIEPNILALALERPIWHCNDWIPGVRVYAFTLGYSRAISEQCRVGLEAFYSPLDIQRPPDTSADNEGLFNLRVMLSYQF